MDRKQLTAEIISRLDSAYPDAAIELKYENPLEILVATILSAQCTDARVNVVTRDLFKKYRTAEDYASVSQEELEEDIRSTGFFRNKARNIRGAAMMLISDFGDRVPGTMEELLRLPGVARKTANVILGNAFGEAAGVVVDTHVFRLSHRLELSNGRTPEKVEQDLMRQVPRERWLLFGHQLIFHGRRICRARKPLCGECPLSDLCPSAGKS
jgi:endonuclease-3